MQLRTILTLWAILAMFGCQLPEDFRAPRLGKSNQFIKQSSFTYWVSDVAFSPDGNTIAIASANENDEYMLRLWDTHTGIKKATLKLPRKVETVRFNPDGITVACAIGNGVSFWNARTGAFKKRLKLKGFSYSMCFSPDGSKIARGDSYLVLRLYDTSTGEFVTTSRVNERDGSSIINECFNPDGTMVAASKGNEIYLWDAQTGKHKITLIGHTNEVKCVCFNPDGTAIATTSYDGTARIWDAHTGERKMTLKHANEVSKSVYSIGDAFYSKDGTIIVSSHSSTLCFWDAHSGKRKAKLILPGPFLAGHATPEGFVIASENEDGKTVLLWDVSYTEHKLVLRNLGGK